LTNKGASIKRFELKKIKTKTEKRCLLKSTVRNSIAIGADDLELSDIPFVVTGESYLDKNPSGSLIFEHARRIFHQTHIHFSNSFKIDIKDEVAGPAFID
jgi:hypothetical protein